MTGNPKSFLPIRRDSTIYILIQLLKPFIPFFAILLYALICVPALKALGLDAGRAMLGAAAIGLGLAVFFIYRAFRLGEMWRERILHIAAMSLWGVSYFCYLIFHQIKYGYAIYLGGGGIGAGRKADWRVLPQEGILDGVILLLVVPAAIFYLANTLPPKRK